MLGKQWLIIPVDKLLSKNLLNYLIRLIVSTWDGLSHHMIYVGDRERKSVEVHVRSFCLTTGFLKAT